MKKNTFSSLPTFLLLILLIAMISRGAESGIVTYWGQNDMTEGTLTEACNSGLYEVINIAFLNQFGNGPRLGINLAAHCNPPNCQFLSQDIRNCQAKNVKVFLSIGGYRGSYQLSSPADARQVADAIWDNFFGGQSNSRPFGAAVLDGVDFDVEGQGRGDAENYAELARRLSERSRQTTKKFFLSAAPQCPFPELAGQQYLSRALATGLFDYVWIQFYNNQQALCEVNSAGFQKSWNGWVSSTNRGKFYVGLPASPDKGAANSGYVQPDIVVNQVLPFVKKSGNKFGGVMIWNRYYDKLTGFSTKIKG